VQIREDFITNSSTTNYILVGKEITFAEIDQYDRNSIMLIDDEYRRPLKFDDYIDEYPEIYEEYISTDIENSDTKIIMYKVDYYEKYSYIKSIMLKDILDNLDSNDMYEPIVLLGEYYS
jgi:hypothetical protein